MAYPKVADFLLHIVTGTNVLIEDDMIEGRIYFEGTIRDYLKSELPSENLTLVQSFIENDVFVVRALKDFKGF